MIAEKGYNSLNRAENQNSEIEENITTGETKSKKVQKNISMDLSLPFERATNYQARFLKILIVDISQIQR